MMKVLIIAILVSLDLAPCLGISLDITADPQTFKHGLTNTLNVTCAFSEMPILESEVSILLKFQRESAPDAAKANSGDSTPNPTSTPNPVDSPTFRNLADISAFSRAVTTYDIDPATTQTNGSFTDHGVSFLTVTISDPRKEHAGLYVCEAIIFKRPSQTFSVMANVTVAQEDPTLDDVIQHVKSLERSMELESENAELRERVDALQSKVTQCCRYYG